MSNTRVTVTLPSPLVEEIDRMERNRSRFVLEAIRRELERRRRERLRLSLQNPHEQSEELGGLGVGDWADGLPDETEDLVFPGAGHAVRWVPGRGWEEG